MHRAVRSEKGVPFGACLVVLALAACSDRPDVGTADASEAADGAVDSLQTRAEGLYAEGDIQQAVPLLEEAVDASRAAGDTAALARGLTWLSQAAWRLGDFEATRSHGEEALALKLASRSRHDLFRSYNILGLLAWNESRPYDAIELFRRAAEVAREEADTTNLAKVWNNLGLVQMSLGDYADAHEGFSEARRSARALGEQRIEGRVLINLANLELETGRPRPAIAHLEAAIPLLRAAEDRVGEQILLGHLGTAHRVLGEPGQAESYLRTALERARRDGLQQEEAINLEQLAELYRGAGDHREALRLFGDARVINERLGLVDEVAIDLRSEAEIHAELGDNVLALDKVRRALRTHAEIGFPLEEIRDLTTMAKLAADLGWRDSAHVHLDRAGRLAAELGTPSARGEVGVGSARVARQFADPRRVLSALDGVESDLVRSGGGLSWEAEALRAWAYGTRGVHDSALAASRRAIRAIERTRADYAATALRASHLSAREAVYAEHARLLLTVGDVRGAFLTADAVRARGLVERLAVGEDVEGMGRAARELIRGETLLQRATELQRRIEEIEALPPEWRSVESDAQVERLRAELDAARAAYGAATHRARAEDPRAAGLLAGAASGFEQVASALRSGEAILEYFVTSDEVLWFVITRDTVISHRSAVPRATLASRVRVARDEAGRSRGAPGVALARLHGDLVGPAIEAGDLAGVDRLLVVPHAELVYVPFAALRDAGTGRYLVEDYAVSHLPSAGLLPLLRDGEPSVTSKVAGFAPVPDELPGTEIELQGIERVVRGATSITGKDATERSVRRQLEESAAIHLAAHGRLNGSSPMYSHIELAAGDGSSKDDGRLEVNELLSVRIASPIVYLSGCETAIGPAWSTEYARGEDYATLSRAFLFAGAEAVIATLWAVEDRGAASFSTKFYTAAARVDAVEALTLAQRAMLRDPRYSAPYYWAAYRLTGRGDVRIAPQ